MPTAAEHPAIASFRRALTQAGGTGRVVVLPDSVHTAALAAEALGCEVGAIANSLVFESGGRPVLVLTSGAHRVDTAKVAADLGVPPLRRAKPDFVRLHTGQVIGGVSPIDHPGAGADVPRHRSARLSRDLGGGGPPGGRLQHQLRRAAPDDGGVRGAGLLIHPLP